MAFQHSRLFRDFECFETVGKGSFGDVRKVKHLADGCIYAVKTVKPKKVKQSRAQLLHEVCVLSALTGGASSLAVRVLATQLLACR